MNNLLKYNVAPDMWRNSTIERENFLCLLPLPLNNTNSIKKLTNFFPITLNLIKMEEKENL